MLAPRPSRAPLGRLFTASALALFGLLALLGCKNRHLRIDDTLTCTAGEGLTIACTGEVGSACEGDPVLSVCDGNVSIHDCNASVALATNDDATPATRCPSVSVVCPASGRATVITRAATGSEYGCYWDIRHGTSLPDAGTASDGGN
ncbi:MAG: hypothetical protein U0234_25580 [Sandaracinus sp.]